jgi:hypothetical protein
MGQLSFDGTCNWFERSFQRLFCSWKLFNQSSYEEVLNPQNYETHYFRILGIPLKGNGKINHFNVIFMEKPKIYYRKESGASPQRLGLCESNELGLIMNKF